MYVVYLNLNDFVAHAGPVIHLEAQHIGTDQVREAIIVLTSPVAPQGPVHGARVVVVDRGMWLFCERTAVQACVRQARGVLGDYLAQQGFSLAPGMCLEPGLYDDLRKLETEQDLFVVQRNGHASCELVRTAEAPVES